MTTSTNRTSLLGAVFLALALVLVAPGAATAAAVEAVEEVAESDAATTLRVAHKRRRVVQRRVRRTPPGGGDRPLPRPPRLVWRARATAPDKGTPRRGPPRRDS